MSRIRNWTKGSCNNLCLFHEGLKASKIGNDFLWDLFTKGFLCVGKHREERNRMGFTGYGFEE